MSGDDPRYALGIKQLRPTDRPRERLWHLGAEALGTPELFALLVGSGGRGYSALDSGRAIMAVAHGSLRRLKAQPVSELTRIPGVGRARAVLVHAGLELGRRWAEEPLDVRTAIGSPADVVELYGGRLRDLPVEEFHVIVLDAQHQVAGDITVTRGLLSSSPVHPREVFRRVIMENAAAVVLLHNHPSGDATPSPDDRAITDQLVAAGRLLDIPVLDHVIIGRGQYTSFLEAGWL
jgi:DNA repair protein RadC